MAYTTIMLYFAYGSNLDRRCLEDWLSRFGVDGNGLGQPVKAILRGFRIRTNYLSALHGAGAANIEEDKRGRVEGVLFEISPEVRCVLRLKEGWPRHYKEERLPVSPGCNGRAVRALTYMAQQEHQLPFDLPVTPDYRDSILTGARQHGLSKAYRRRLERILRPLS